MMTDIEIAQQCRMRPITEIAALPRGSTSSIWSSYGRYKAKVDHRLLTGPGRPARTAS